MISQRNLCKKQWSMCPYLPYKRELTRLNHLICDSVRELKIYLYKDKLRTISTKDNSALAFPGKPQRTLLRRSTSFGMRTWCRSFIIRVSLIMALISSYLSSQTFQGRVFFQGYPCLFRQECTLGLLRGSPWYLAALYVADMTAPSTFWATNLVAQYAEVTALQDEKS